MKFFSLCILSFRNFWVRLLLVPAVLFALLLLCFGREAIDSIALLPVEICYILVGTVLAYAHITESRPKIDRVIAGHSGKNIVWGVIIIAFFPLILAGLLHLLGVTPYELAPKSDSVKNNIFWSLFNAFISLDNKSVHGSTRGGLIAWEVGMIGMFLFSGILVPFLVGYLERHRARWEEGKIYYGFKRKKYLVVIGSHESIASIIVQASKKYTDTSYYIVYTDRDISYVRNRLLSKLEYDLYKKVIFYSGTRDSALDLTNIQPESLALSAIYIIGETDGNYKAEDGIDSKNLQCANIISSLCKGKRTDRNGDIVPVDCYMMFEHDSSYNALIKNGLPSDFSQSFNFTPFNFYEFWAQKVLTGMPNSGSVSYLPIDYRLVQTDGATIAETLDANSDSYVHIVVFGISNIGIAIAKEAALICHYPNYASMEREDEKTGGNKRAAVRTRITFVDSEAEKHRQYLLRLYPLLFGLNNWTDIEWTFIEGTINSEKVLELIDNEARNKKCMLTLAMCNTSDDINIEDASYLPQSVYDNALEILIYQRQSKDIVDLLSGHLSSCSNQYNRLRPFGMIDECFDHMLLDSYLAKLIHYCKYDNGPLNIKNMNWRGKTLLQRWSSIYSAHGWYAKLRALGIDLNAYFCNIDNDTDFEKALVKVIGELKQKFADRDLMGRTEHNRWIMERILIIREKHRDICPFEELVKNHPEVIDYDINRLDRLIKVLPTYAKLTYKKEYES